MRFIACLVFLSASLLFVPCSAAEVKGRVVGVYDGDTVTVLGEEKQTHKIRLAGIDAPEKKQAFGERAKQLLSDLAYGRDVVVETGKKDRYGREVGKLLVNRNDINLLMVRSGMAWHYKQYEREQSRDDRTTYAAAETSARDRRLGLWKDNDPVPPWQWRKQKKAQ